MCPLGADQTTRGPPRWTLLAPELKQRQALPQEHRSDRTSYRSCGAQRWFFEDGLSWGAFEKLARTKPGDDTCTQTPFLPAWLGRPTTTSLSTLESLPAELFRMITSRLEIPDRAALGLCSQWLWCHFVRELQAAYSASVAPWAGQIVICTSTYLTDVPPEIHAICPEIREKTEKWLAGRRAGRYQYGGMAPARRWNRDAIYKFADARNLDLDLESQCLEALKRHAESDGLSEDLQATLRTKIKKEALCPRRALLGSAWVLRNLNTREVVRFELTKAGSSSRNAQAAVRDFPWLTLDLKQIIAADKERNPLHYGVWAGHRFDMIEADDLDPKEEWRDVTDEAVSEAKVIKQSFARN